MNTRSRLAIAGLIAVVLIALGAGGFFAFRDKQPLPEQGEQPKPTPAKTTADLLLGTWQQVKSEHPPLPEFVEIYCTFTTDGKYEVRSKDIISGEQFRTGTYRLDESRIYFMLPESARDNADSWEMKIESITDEKLVLVGQPDTRGKSSRAEYKRVQRKYGID